MLQLFAQVAEPNKFADFIDKVARTPLSQVVLFVAVCTVLRLAIFPLLARTKPHQRGGGYGFARFLNESLDAVIYAGVFVFLLIRPFAIQAFKIPSGSMLNTLLINDFIVANKAIYRYSDPKHGDIVVFKPPKTATDMQPPEQRDVDYIKRCIGVPGDVIEIKDGTLYRNSQPVDEKYIFFLDPYGHPIPESERRDWNRDFKLVEYEGKIWPLTINGDLVNAEPGRSASDFMIMDQEKMRMMLRLPPAPVPKGFYLMMGDNRYNSFDGRGWGLVPRDDIIGRAEFIWWPPRRWGITR